MIRALMLIGSIPVLAQATYPIVSGAGYRGPALTFVAPCQLSATLQYEEIRIVEPRRGQLGGRLPSFIGKLESASACQDRIESASEKIGR